MLGAILGLLGTIIGFVSTKYVNIGFVSFNQASATSGTWYTAANISNKGRIDDIGLIAVNAAASNLLEIRVTIDGGTATAITGGNNVPDGNYGSLYVNGTSLNWKGQMEFATSILIEARQLSGATTGLQLSASYSTI